MTNLLDVIQSLQETEAALVKLQDDATIKGRSRSATLVLNSLRKRHGELEKMFASMTAEEHLDVFNYRLIAEKTGRYTLTALTKALGDFQSLMTVVYDALKNGERKLKAQVSAEVASETALNFGYSYSGSLGFVFTIPNERLLLVESVLDSAMSTIFELAKAGDTATIAEFARKLGPAPIRLMYKWASDNIQSDLSAEIGWKRGEEVRASLVIQKEELEHLCKVIDQTGEEKEEEVITSGILVGGDLKTRTFRFNPETGEEIRGHMAEQFQSDEELKLGHGYIAELIKKTKIHYSIEKEDVFWYLKSLK